MLFRAIWTVVFVLSGLTCLSILFSAFVALHGPVSPEAKPIHGALTEEPEEQVGPMGLGCGFLIALTLGYFAWFGMTA